MSTDLPVLDHVYCINLETCTERKQHMKKQFKKHKLSATFVKAIHTKHTEYRDLLRKPKGKLQNSNKAKRCYCAHQCNHKIRTLRPTEIAIVLSHYHVYRKIIKNDDYWALICEDDVKFNDNFIEIINTVVPMHIWESQTPMIINCGGYNDNFDLKNTEVPNFDFQYTPLGAYSNYCFFINQKAARVLLKHMFPIIRPDDSYKRHIILKRKIQCYRIRPAIVAELSAGRNANPIYQRLSHEESTNHLSKNKSDLREPKKSKKIPLIPTRRNGKWRSIEITTVSPKKIRVFSGQNSKPIPKKVKKITSSSRQKKKTSKTSKISKISKISETSKKN